MGKKFVQWGYVAIATNLCHSGGVPVGSPGDGSFANSGASYNNVLRNMKCWDILASLGYVDTNCIATSGNSHGSFSTTALAAAFPEKFACAAHTGGGVTYDTTYAAPTPAQVVTITCPYIIHHGDSDHVYPIAMDSTLKQILDSTGCVNEFYVYPGYSHGMVTMDSAVLARTRAFFLLHQCRTVTTSVPEHQEAILAVSPNPVSSILSVTVGEPAQIFVYDLHGREFFSGAHSGSFTLNVSDFPEGPAAVVAVTRNAILRQLITVLH
jgi:dienelactone hydrolase